MEVRRSQRVKPLNFFRCSYTVTKIFDVPVLINFDKLRNLEDK